MTVRVRPAEPRDAAAIRAVHLAAFPTAVEADLVGRLDAGRDSVVSLAVDADGELVGHVLLSRMRVSGDGREFRALGLGPVGVIPGHQGAGLGAALIGGALAIARATGEELVFVLGEPDYYRRFGFSAAAAAPFASPYAGPYFMALALSPDLKLPVAGQAAYAKAFGDIAA